jgi:hypothetical protein
VLLLSGTALLPDASARRRDERARRSCNVPLASPRIFTCRPAWCSTLRSGGSGPSPHVGGVCVGALRTHRARWSNRF